jgi:ketosteroid isomerase-like protein
VSRLRRFYDAENLFIELAPEDRDISIMLAELDPDVVVQVPDSLPHGGTWIGHDGFRELFGVVAQHWSEFEVVYDESKWHRVGDDRVLVECFFRGVLHNGQAVFMPVVSLLTFTDRGASRLDHFYKDTAVIVEAARADRP